MKHLGVRAEAFQGQLESWLPGRSIWRMALYVVAVSVGAVVWARLDGLTLMQALMDDMAILHHQIVLFIVLYFAIQLPVWCCALVAMISGAGAESDYLAAFEDAASPVWLKKYSAHALADLSDAKGADAWAQIWRDRRDGLD